MFCMLCPSLHTCEGLEGQGGVPSIRPLETLHNALSLKTLDEFLQRCTRLTRSTPMSSPPKTSPRLHHHHLPHHHHMHHHHHHHLKQQQQKNIAGFHTSGSSVGSGTAALPVGGAVPAHHPNLHIKPLGGDITPASTTMQSPSSASSKSL